MSRSPNTLWATAFVDELARAGVTEVVLAPGSRSTPLVMACAADQRVRTRVHLDERSAAFFALGVGKATGRPAAVVTTSGTAVANVFPAVIEASQSGVPLVVLTADRPHRLRGADANQAIDQPGIYGGYVRAFFEAAPPSLDPRELRHLRALACRTVAAACGSDAGPVHVNFPFDKPLAPEPLDEAFANEHPLATNGRPDGASFTAIGTAGAKMSEPDLQDWRTSYATAKESSSPDPASVRTPLGPAVMRLAAAAGFPVLADPLSGARYGPKGGAHVVAAADLFLRDDAVRARLAPEVIVRVGASPTSATVQRWLFEHQGVPQIVIDDGPRWKDHGTTASDYVRADPVDTLDRLAVLLSGGGCDRGAIAGSVEDHRDRCPGGVARRADRGPGS